MKERFKIYFGVAGSRAKKVALTRVRLFDIIVLVFAASVSVGVMIGYVQSGGLQLISEGGLQLLSEARDQVQKTVDSWAAVPPDPAKSPPALPPVRRAPAARPALQPGPFVSDPGSTSVSMISRGGSVASAAAPFFRVQVGAFRLRANAEALAKQLSRDGFKASISQTSDLYKVQIGAFGDRKEANRLAKELKAKRYDVLVTQATADK